MKKEGHKSSKKKKKKKNVTHKSFVQVSLRIHEHLLRLLKYSNRLLQSLGLSLQVLVTLQNLINSKTSQCDV